MRTRILGMQMSLVEEPSRIETQIFRSLILTLSVSSKTLALLPFVVIQQAERQISRSLTLSIISLRHLAGPSASDRQVSRPSSQRTCWMWFLDKNDFNVYYIRLIINTYQFTSVLKKACRGNIQGYSQRIPNWCHSWLAWQSPYRMGWFQASRIFAPPDDSLRTQRYWV